MRPRDDQRALVGWPHLPMPVRLTTRTGVDPLVKIRAKAMSYDKPGRRRVSHEICTLSTRMELIKGYLEICSNLPFL
jgi:hypothetical protein